MAAHQLPDVTVGADAGMVSEPNQKQIEAAGLPFFLVVAALRIAAGCWELTIARSASART